MAVTGFTFPRVELDAEARALRAEVRAFLADEEASGGFTATADAWGSGWSSEFSRKLGQRGWLAITWPKQYGGHERPALHRFIVTEEIVSAGAPVNAHWIADRQSGPLLIRFGSDEVKREILPRIARGACYFAIGMSEPDSGSDLASLRTSAKPVEGGWRINGRKIWNSGTHNCHYMIALVRTAPPDAGNRHAGFSQFVIDLSSPGVEIRPIVNMAGEHHFNETVLDDVFVPSSHVVGEIGQGWMQVISELAIERSGPERFLSSFVVMRELLREITGESNGEAGERGLETMGRLTARLKVLRRMSLGVAALLNEGVSTETEAALVKEVGTRFEGEIVEAARLIAPARPLGQSPDAYAEMLQRAILYVPSSTLRGGTSEVLRGIVARQLGLR